MAKGKHIAPKTRSGRVSWGIMGLVFGLFFAMSFPAGAAGGGAQHYTWDDGVGAYGGPAAAVVNAAGAIVWWQVPGTDGPDTANPPSWYKDVYKAKPFDGSSPFSVGSLNEPTRWLIQNAFPGLETIYYTREVVDSAPKFPNAETLTSTDLVSLGADELVSS